MTRLNRVNLMFLCLMMPFMATAQLIELEGVPIRDRSAYHGGLYFSGTPIGTLFYEVGNRNMRKQLEQLGLPNGDRFLIDKQVYSLGYWRSNWMVQLDYFTRAFLGNAAARNDELGANQIFYSTLQNRALQLGVGYRFMQLKERNDLYLKAAMGWHWNTIGLGITGSNVPVDFNNPGATPAFVGLPRLQQSAPHLDVSIEMRPAIKRRLELIDGFSFGCRYGLASLPWQAELVPAVNAIADRSVLIYTKVSFGVRLNKQK